MTVPTTFIVFTLSELGIFDILAQHLWVINAYFPIPAEGLSIIAAHLVSFVASATVASSLLSSGIISAKDCCFDDARRRCYINNYSDEVVNSLLYWDIWNKNRNRNHAHCDFNKNKYHDRCHILAPSSLVIIPD